MILETILGGVTGLIGNVVGGWFKLKHAKLQKEIREGDRNHEVAMVAAETEAMIMEAKANIKITQSQVEGAIDLKDAEAFMLSQKEGNKALFDSKWINSLMSTTGWWKIFTLPLASLIAVLFGLTDFLRGIIRPALTVYLCGVTTWVTWMAWSIMQTEGMTISVFQAVDIFKDTTSIVTYLTVSCVTWWFGDRTIAKSIMEMNGADVRKMDDEIKI